MTHIWMMEYYHSPYRNTKDYKGILWTTYANQLDNIDEMNKLLKRHNYKNLPKGNKKNKQTPWMDLL